MARIKSSRDITDMLDYLEHMLGVIWRWNPTQLEPVVKEIVDTFGRAICKGNEARRPMTPTKHQRIEIELTVGDDFVRFDGAPNIPRPLHISRSKWRAFWQHFAAQRASPDAMLAAARMLSNNPDLTEADLWRRPRE